jgi:sarcosine oxidase subunit alpha
MKTDYDVIIVGGGPSGLCSAIALGKTNLKVLLLERDPFLGGQLVKQTHMFFGSKEQYAGTRGFEIGKMLENQVRGKSNITIQTDCIASAYYPEEKFLLTLQNDKKLNRVSFKKIIIATGASEKFLLFENNAIPGIYGAGAVQTLMNLYGVLPGQEVVMVGSGNIGLIVSYQLMQAGAKVKAIIEAAPQVGGYFVHAAKIRRLGVPILTKTTIKKAIGEKAITGVETIELDNQWNMIPGTEKQLTCDTLCLSVGLNPLTELLFQMGCEMKYVPELSGSVPIRDFDLKTTNHDVYIAGDAAGVEEASSAMLEGTIAGISVAESLGFASDNFTKKKKEANQFLEAMRSGAIGDKIRAGLQKVEVRCV